MASRQRVGHTAHLLLLFLFVINQKEQVLAGVMDNFNDGLKMAGQMFGINTAADVANLVAKAFSGAASNTRRKPDIMSVLQHGFQQNQYEDDEQQSEVDQSGQHAEPENAQETPPIERPSSTVRPNDFNSGQMLSNMLRMVGFDARKLGALAINALVMIAQAIGSTLMQATRGGSAAASSFSSSSTGPEALYEPSEHQPRSLPLGSPIDWFLERPNDHTKQLLNHIMDRELPERIVDMIESKESSQKGNEAACLKLLMCKSSPIIWGMQKSLKKRLNGESEESESGENTNYFNTGVFFKHLPTMDEFREHGSTCEMRFAKYCPRNQTLDQKLK